MRIALLIDGENVPPGCLADVLTEVSQVGTPVVKRLYGNFTGKSQRWAHAARAHGLTPMQCFSTAGGKNSADIQLAVDAVTLLHRHRWLTCFCIVSSDSDFAPVAMLLREHGKLVHGIGYRTTPRSFVKQCNRFTRIDDLASRRHGLDSTQRDRWKRPLSDASRVIYPALMSLGGGTRWVSLSELGEHLMQLEPDFDPRNYRCRNLGTLVAQLDLLEVSDQGVPAAVRFGGAAELKDHLGQTTE